MIYIFYSKKKFFESISLKSQHKLLNIFNEYNFNYLFNNFRYV